MLFSQFYAAKFNAGLPFRLLAPADDVRGVAASSRKQRVLVVDDEGLIADSVAEILSESGFDATAVYSGADALDHVRTHCPDIIVSDVLMPRMNGVETAIAIRQLCPKARVVLFSGQAATADILKDARKDGHVFELIPKPIHPEQLLKKLSS